ncbi:helix-turn-helix transcriptional regulator [Micromonospora haikouensis]|uniref:helix-turn-helix domain-containing protein n=1 Tax=Micromonospora haikouensis TaxID=686309 RepID=UPI003447B423
MSDNVHQFGPSKAKATRRPVRRAWASTTPVPTAVEVAADFEPYRLVQARHLAAIGRQDLAAAVGVPPWRIVHWESRISTPVAYEVEKLARALDVPVGFFKGGRPMAYLSAADVHWCGGDR